MIIAEQSMKILEVFDVVTTAISLEEKDSASTIIFYYRQIYKKLNTFDFNTVTENMIKKLQLELRKRFNDIQENNFIA